MKVRNFIAGLAVMVCSHANAFDFVENTYFVSLKQGSVLSERVRSLHGTGYESATGEKIKMDNWYSTKFVDVHAEFFTQVNQQFGVIWGFSTGEKGPKYTIDPSVKLGGIFKYDISKSSSVIVKGYRVFGGRLHEKSCTADYGDIGGVQEANCRLAATEMQPSETLNYMMNQRPVDYKMVSIQFKFEF